VWTAPFHYKTKVIYFCRPTPLFKCIDDWLKALSLLRSFYSCVAQAIGPIFISFLLDLLLSDLLNIAWHVFFAHALFIMKQFNSLSKSSYLIMWSINKWCHIVFRPVCNLQNIHYLLRCPDHHRPNNQYTVQGVSLRRIMCRHMCALTDSDLFRSRTLNVWPTLYSIR